MDQKEAVMRKIAAVIVTYNRKDLLKECIEAILKQKAYIPDIIVVDNDSRDGTRDALTPYVDTGQVHYYNTGANLGGAGGFQFGIRKGVELGYKYLWIMDDDCMPGDMALSAMLSAAKRHPDFGFLSSKVLWQDGNSCRMNVQRESLTKNVKDFDRKLIPVVAPMAAKRITNGETKPTAAAALSSISLPITKPSMTEPITVMMFATKNDVIVI